MQLLNNLYQVVSRKKKTGIICCMPTPLVYLQQGNVKKSKNERKIVNIDEENLHVFRTT